MELFVFLLIWGGLAWGIGLLAESRGRSLPGFALLSFFFSPLLALIVVLVMPNLAARAEEDAERERARREEHERQLEQIRALTSQPSNSEGVVSGSVADELRKLAELRDQGILTDAEFQDQKSALLNSKQQPAQPVAVRPWH